MCGLIGYLFIFECKTFKILEKSFRPFWTSACAVILIKNSSILCFLCLNSTKIDSHNEHHHNAKLVISKNNNISST